MQFRGAGRAWEACVVRKPMIAVLAVLASSPVLAQSTEHRHLGFFLRLNGGLGYLDGSASGLDVSGASGVFGLSIGGALAENLVLSGSVWDSSAVNPTASYQGQSAQLSNANFAAVAFAPELTYYVMPLNLYLSGALGFGRLVYTANGNSSSTSDLGPALRTSVGKEWWVSGHWGIGVAGHLSFASNGDGNTTWSTWGTAVTFSATYN